MNNTTPTIVFPERFSEFEIQAELFLKLKKRYSKQGFSVRGEVLGKNGLSRNRFDIVIFLDKQPQIVIEVKRSKKGVGAKQMCDYMKYNVPLVYCNNKSDIKLVMRSIAQHFNKVFASKVFLPKGYIKPVRCSK